MVSWWCGKLLGGWRISKLLLGGERSGKLFLGGWRSGKFSLGNWWLVDIVFDFGNLISCD